MAWLNWPEELATGVDQKLPRYSQVESLRLDLHGDPTKANLIVFSDGNHHMALQETLHAFSLTQPEIGEIFYTTTPPGIAMQMLRGGGIEVGNLRLTLTPHVFISPPVVLESLEQDGYMKGHTPFMSSRGMVLLVQKDNPKNISGIMDLLRPDVRLFLSNPATEKISNKLYTDCLRRLAVQKGIILDFLVHPPGQANPAKLVYGESIHHREAPQTVTDGRADAALVFYHLALRYKRIFPDLFDFVWPMGSLGDQARDINFFSCGLVGNGGKWGPALLDFLMSDTVTRIYESHGLLRADPALNTKN